jgi:lipoprotein-anchoring transpeptidase ErfK/SrfK
VNTATILRVLVLLPIFTTSGVIAAEKPRDRAAMEQATRLQVFLDRANFRPGKIDGRDGEFTKKALALYKQTHGEPAMGNATESDAVFTEYTVTQVDLESIGDLPESIEEKAKVKWMPYRTAAEAIAEKFHCDIDFLGELNPGKTEHINAGDRLTVPNVEPFELGSVKGLKPGSESDARAINDLEAESDLPPVAEKTAGDSKRGDGSKDQSAPTNISIVVSTQSSMLEVHDGDSLIAAFPVTVGSQETASPIGDWKIRGISKFPTFRYDRKMLNEGERSGDFKLLPPGPNNLVGVLWISLNKKGIGIHGTDNPDSIGRSASHGCIRLANWDVVKLASLVKTGVPVSIQ